MHTNQTRPENTGEYQGLIRSIPLLLLRLLFQKVIGFKPHKPPCVMMKHKRQEKKNNNKQYEGNQYYAKESSRWMGRMNELNE